MFEISEEQEFFRKISGFWVKSEGIPSKLESALRQAGGDEIPGSAAAMI